MADHFPTLLKLTCIASKAPDLATVTEWNFVRNNSFTPPPASQISAPIDSRPATRNNAAFSDIQAGLIADFRFGLATQP